MSWRPSRASAKSSQSSRFASGTGERWSTGAGLGRGLRGAASARVSCLGVSPKRESISQTAGKSGSGSDRGRLRCCGVIGWATWSCTPSSEPSSRAALSRGQNQRAHQASMTVFRRQYGVPGVVRSSTILSRGIASCGLRQVLRAPDVDGAADLAFGDAQALDDEGPQVLGADRQGLQALDLGQLVASGPSCPTGALRSCLRHVASCFAWSGASSLASFSPATAPQPAAGSRKWWTWPDGILPAENG